MEIVQDFSRTIELLEKYDTLSLDTETTGLLPYKDDRLFAIIIATKDNEYYFNYNLLNNPLSSDTLPEFTKLLKNKKIFMANAKFDLAFLEKEGITVDGNVIDILVQARLIQNDLLKYSLASCAERAGMQKLDIVEKYISENGLHAKDEYGDTKKFYNAVPLEIMSEYACKDARLTYDLGVKYEIRIDEISSYTTTGLNPLSKVAENEYRFTKTCYNMEKLGIKIDKVRIHNIDNYIGNSLFELLTTFKQITGNDFKDSNKFIYSIFYPRGCEGGRTEKGNPRFDEKALKEIINSDKYIPKKLAKIILEIRELHKIKASYCDTIKKFMSNDGVIHCDIKQAGTTTGRISIKNPALQTIPKDGGIVPIKGCFIPREDYFFVEFDYMAFEYRMMVEYAKEEILAKKIKEGVDVHQATADMMGVDRKTAKTLNFMLLYGGGTDKLAESLGVDRQKAELLKYKYFMALPRTREFITRVNMVANGRRMVVNWLGRISRFDAIGSSYKAPNALIQGGCADVVKVAMNVCDSYLSNKKSNMLLQVHDSILFEIHKDEKDIIPHLKNILEKTYPSKLLKMEVEGKYSKTNWNDMVDLPKKGVI